MSITAHNIGGTAEVPEISFDVVGSRGHIYKTVIGKLPRCNCPDVRFRKAQCKHICFARLVLSVLSVLLMPMHCQVLSAIDVPGKLRYQRSLLPSLPVNQELRQMLTASSLENIEDSSTLISASQRKPIEGECPVCFNDFKTNQVKKACHSCGNIVELLLTVCFLEGTKPKVSHL
ncbi:hypothetical protein N7517_005463 [Penicillium concentricum]|uniref:SWIM-type domain-containing protein n=1 Tax=Penicillium concentricum TaxID=293559 RepID=A0A9W9S8A1_9EURO|nr:uncharacterized protein N7517_005463 [Penicillium concentricum]KAJ5373457.1 hypothetical protein N7517_005463 [Penicillium concentricum]